MQQSRSQAHDNARMVTEIIAAELRSAVPQGILVAENKRIVVRSAIVVGVVCGTPPGPNDYVYLDGGEAAIDTLDLTGVGRYSGGAWSYYSTTWNNIDGSGGTPASTCASNGSDTTGISGDFTTLRRLNTLGGATSVGDLFMLYQEIEYELDTSTMDPTTVGLYRGKYGDTLTEYATGMDTTAQFQYRTGGASYATSVSGAGLANIDAVRIVAQARARVAAGGTEDVTYGWSVNVPLRNAP